MKLASARELKAALRDGVVDGMAEALRREAALVTTASRSAALPAVARTLSLGIAPAAPGDFKLAVRVQRRGLEDAAQLDTIRSRARGEIDVRYVGRVAALARRRAADADVPWAQGRTRPLLIGASIGHYRITAGTLGAFVVLRKGGQVRILSNNHVLADEDRGKKGDAVLQPGAYDGGRAPQDKIGGLDRAVKLKPRGTNLVDAALCTIDGAVAYDPRTLRGVGTLAGLAGTPLEETHEVEKLGRTTGHTHGPCHRLRAGQRCGGLRGGEPALRRPDRGRVGRPWLLQPGRRQRLAGLRLRRSRGLRPAVRGQRPGRRERHRAHLRQPFHHGARAAEGRPAGLTSMATLAEARSAKRKAAQRLTRVPQVNGIGVERRGRGYGLKVNLAEAVGADVIPEAVDGVPLRAVVVGGIRRRSP